MVKITFENFLRLGVGRDAFGDTPEGDFAADALRDQNFVGRDFEKWEDLERFLVFHRAIPEAVRAAKKLFRKWQAGS